MEYSSGLVLLTLTPQSQTSFSSLFSARHLVRSDLTISKLLHASGAHFDAVIKLSAIWQPLRACPVCLQELFFLIFAEQKLVLNYVI
jgi:hypothetical protein